MTLFRSLHSAEGMFTYADGDTELKESQAPSGQRPSASPSTSSLHAFRSRHALSRRLSDVNSSRPWAARKCAAS